MCRSWADSVASVHRLVGDRWERVRIDERLEKSMQTTAVGPDGALWIGLDDGKLLRISAKHVTDTFELPKADAKLGRASYWSSETYALPSSAKGDDLGGAARRFEQVGVAPAAEPNPIARIEEIVPRADGEAWVVAAETRPNGGTVVVHMGRPAIAPLPDALLVGTETDQRNEIRNSRPPIAWVGHCPQLFIALAKQRVDGSLASEAMWSRETAIAATVNKVFGSRTSSTPNAALVEGRLGGRRVAGVLVWRPAPEASQDLLEKNTRSIAAEIATGPVTEITCTAPVLDRASLVRSSQ
jgi:hypothetical protein